MLLSASLVPITIVTEDFDQAVIWTKALKCRLLTPVAFNSSPV